MIGFTNYFIVAYSQIEENEKSQYVLIPDLHLRNFSARNMGPNALPVPEALFMPVSDRIEFETRISAHVSSEENSKDLYLRLNYPVVPEIVSLELSNSIVEYYSITREQQLQRKILNSELNHQKPNITGFSNGDICLTTMVQVFKNKRFPDLVLRASLRTASGNDRENMRHVDAPGYFFDATFSKKISYNSELVDHIGVHFSSGFYCWQTYDDFHPQNDAFLAIIGGNIIGGKIMINGNIGGYFGYMGNGDQPVVVRTNIGYSTKKMMFALGFQKGIHDFDYTSLRLGLTLFLEPIKIDLTEKQRVIYK
jgi:hypothetical protein